LDNYCSSPYWGVPLDKAFHSGGELVCYRAPGEANLAVFYEREVQGGTLLVPPDAFWLLGSPLLGPDPRAQLGELLRFWSAHPSPQGIRQVLISGLYPDHPLLDVRFWEPLGGWEIETSQRMVASLEGGVDGFMSRRSKNFRSRLRRTIKAATASGLEVEPMPVSCSAAEANAILERVFEIESRSWKGLSGQGIDQGNMREFYRCMVPLLASKGRLRGLFLTRDGSDKAYLFGGLFDDCFRGLQFSFLNTETIGLGNVCQFHMLSLLCQEGCKDYDLGQGMDYKKRWSESHIVSRSFVFQV